MQLLLLILPAMSDFPSSLASPSVQAVAPGDLLDFWNFKYSLINASLPLLACSLFFTCSVTHLSIAVITKRFYMLPLTAGCVLGIVGEIFKILCVLSTSPSKALNYYVLYSIATNLVPCLFLTSIGWMVRRMIDGSPQSQFPWPARMVSHQIFTLEVGAFSLQAYGLLVQANPSLTRYWDVGNWVTVFGAAVEVLSIFMVWLSLWIVMRKRRLRISVIAHQQSSTNFSAFAKVVAASVSFVLVRSVSRIVSHLMSDQLKPFRTELLIFLLEGLPLALCALFLIVLHPCRYDGGILSQTPSFFSPETRLAAPAGSEMQESAPPWGGVPIERFSHLDQDMGPFWTVPLSPQHQSPRGSSKRGSIHVRMAEPDEGHAAASSHNSPPREVLHRVSRRSVSESGCDPVGTTPARMDGMRADDIQLHLSRFRQPSDTAATTDDQELASTAHEVCIRRRTHSVLSFDKNPLGIAEFHNDFPKNMRQNPLDAYSISSYYDGASRTFAKDWADEIFSRDMDTKFGAWDEESVYSTEESRK